MKNTFAVIIVLLSFNSTGQSNLPIYKNVEFSSAFDWDKMSNSELLVPSPFAKPELRITTPIDFEKFEVSKITYYYSQNKSNPNFGQSDLSNERYQNLIDAYPQINPEKVDWSTKVQNVCDHTECSEELFHGFVIELSLKEKVEERILPAFGHEQLEDQTFRIKGEQESVIIGKDGTKILIPPHAFVDSRGRVAQGNLTIKLKEALNLKDIVFGNLNTITSSGEALMSKGMVKVNAFKGKYALELAEGKFLTIEVPTKFEEGYSYYKGQTENGELTWNEPELILKDPKIKMNEANRVRWGFDLVQKEYVEKVGNHVGLDTVLVHMWNKDLYFTKSSYDPSEAIRLGVYAKVARKIEKWFEEDELNFNDVANKFYGTTWYKYGWLPWIWAPTRWDGKVFIHERENSEVGNILSMSNLGWANIDCLARLKNTTKTSFNVALDAPSNLEDFKIALIVPKVNSMIPGFKRENGNYAFTHGEYEDKVQMPRNEKVFVMASGIKNNKQYFAIEEYTIGKNPVVELEMQQVEQEEMLKQLEETL